MKNMDVQTGVETNGDAADQATASIGREAMTVKNRKEMLTVYDSVEESAAADKVQVRCNTCGVVNVLHEHELETGVCLNRHCGEGEL